MDDLDVIPKDLDALAVHESSKGYLQFLHHVIVDAQPRKLPFRHIGERWQWERAMRSAGALDHLAGIRSEYDGVKSFWNGYHKGSDKTHDNAREICWLLGWSRTRLNLYVCGGSEDQAALIVEAMKGICLDNPWVAERVRVTDLTARGNNGSELTVLSMNAYTSQGVFPDYIVASEITHWLYDEGRTFWDFVLSSVNKRPGCVLKVETNAGHVGSWQWDERNRIQQSKFWSFFEAPVGKPLPQWMNQEKIDDDSKGMEPGERDRLYKNRWIDPGEEHGYLTLAEAEACVDLSRGERTQGRKGELYYIAVDYGGVTDRCALAVLHPVKGTDRIEIDRLDCWQGSHSNPVQISQGITDGRSVEEWIDVALINFPGATLIFDPYQMESLAQKYERRGRRVKRFEYRGGKSNYEMAQLLKNCVQNRKLSWSREAGLLTGAEDDTFAKELARLVKRPMSYGYRFDHEAGRHDDRSTTIGSALVHIIPEMPGLGGGPQVVNKAEGDFMQRASGYPTVKVDWGSKRNIFGMGGQ